jgi:hypothetical protein
MAIKLELQNSQSTAKISILVNISNAQRPIDFKNTAMLDVKNLDVPVDPTLPFLTYKAIEAACISGGIYARRKLGVSGLAIELVSYAWNGDVENAEPFAIAIMIASSKAMSNEILFSETELRGWREIEF